MKTLKTESKAETLNNLYSSPEKSNYSSYNISSSKLNGVSESQYTSNADNSIRKLQQSSPNLSQMDGSPGLKNRPLYNLNASDSSFNYQSEAVASESSPEAKESIPSLRSSSQSHSLRSSSIC